jgi:hypothetical protein
VARASRRDERRWQRLSCHRSTSTCRPDNRQPRRRSHLNHNVRRALRPSKIEITLFACERSTAGAGSLYIDASFNPSLIEQGSSRSHSDPASKPADSYGKLTLSDAPSDAGYDAVPNMLIEDHCKLID